jgi:hypothetical protein
MVIDIPVDTNRCVCYTASLENRLGWLMDSTIFLVSPNHKLKTTHRSEDEFRIRMNREKKL